MAFDVLDARKGAEMATRLASSSGGTKSLAELGVADVSVTTFAISFFELGPAIVDQLPRSRGRDKSVGS